MGVIDVILIPMSLESDLSCEVMEFLNVSICHHVTPKKAFAGIWSEFINVDSHVLDHRLYDQLHRFSLRPKRKIYIPKFPIFRRVLHEIKFNDIYSRRHSA